MDLEYGIVCVIAIMSVIISILRCEKAERKAEELAEKYSIVESSNERIFDAYRALKEKTDQLEARLEELPTDQLQQIYDSEKQFQDGLNSILNYFGPPKENENK